MVRRDCCRWPAVSSAGVPALALASAVAFTISEIADMDVYTPLRRHHYLWAAVASNIARAAPDTAVFVPNGLAWRGQPRSDPQP